jgi:hypothetical protein
MNILKETRAVYPDTEGVDQRVRLLVLAIDEGIQPDACYICHQPILLGDQGLLTIILFDGEENMGIPCWAHLQCIIQEEEYYPELKEFYPPNYVQPNHYDGEVFTDRVEIDEDEDDGWEHTYLSADIIPPDDPRQVNGWMCFGCHQVVREGEWQLETVEYIWDTDNKDDEPPDESQMDTERSFYHLECALSTNLIPEMSKDWLPPTYSIPGANVDLTITDFEEGPQPCEICGGQGVMAGIRFTNTRVGKMVYSHFGCFARMVIEAGDPGLEYFLRQADRRFFPELPILEGGGKNR